MAALIRHGLALRNTAKCTSTLGAVVGTSHGTAPTQLSRHMSKRVDLTPVNRKLRATQASLAAKGFLRPRKAYEPAHGATTRITKICSDHGLNPNDDTKIEGLETRYDIFSACAAELGHSIPNSLLCFIQTIGQLKEFYLTPVDTSTPYDTLLKMDLPKNLHIQKNPVRFDIELDTMFKGKTAFPNSSTLVTGLKYRKKYRGHVEEHPYLKQLRPKQHEHFE